MHALRLLIISVLFVVFQLALTGPLPDLHGLPAVQLAPVFSHKQHDPLALLSLCMQALS